MCRGGLLARGGEPAPPPPPPPPPRPRPPLRAPGSSRLAAPGRKPRAGGARAGLERAGIVRLDRWAPAEVRPATPAGHAGGLRQRPRVVRIESERIVHERRRRVEMA